MNRNMLQSLASDWTRMAKNDIRTKVIEFMNEVNTTTKELAYALAISEGELEQILRGNGEITLSTFAKLLIATGNALEIKPIEQTPIGNYNNIPREQMPPMPRMRQQEQPRPAIRTERENNTFNREREQRPINENRHNEMPFGMPPFPPRFPINFGMDDEDDLEKMNEETEFPRMQPRDARGRFQPFERREQPQRPTPNTPTRPTSKFASMSREKLIDIIKDNLWDTEIDVLGSTFNNLVKFLDDKDKKIEERKRMRDAEADPTVVDFKNRVKESLKSNPHLRNYLKNLLGEVE